MTMRTREFECVLLMNRLTDEEKLEMFTTLKLMSQMMMKDYEFSAEKYPDSYFAKKLREYLRMVEHDLGRIASKREREVNCKRPLEMFK